MRSLEPEHDGGWTLLELMMVVLILGILVSIALASYALTAEKARRVVCQENQRNITTAIQVYQGKEGHQPANLDDLAPYLAGHVATRCPDGPTYSYDATTGVVTCPIHPPQ